MTRQEAEMLAHAALSAARHLTPDEAAERVRDIIEEARDRLSDILWRMQTEQERKATRDLFQ